MVPGGHGSMGALRRPGTPGGRPRVPEPTGRAFAKGVPPNLLPVPCCPSGNDIEMAGGGCSYCRTSALFHVPTGQSSGGP
eukprot:8324588-Lingulodinium_polyedra.AAC.1